MTDTKDKEVFAYSGKMKKQINDKTKNIEANIISCLWEDPQLYLDFSNQLDANKFKSPIWKFYFAIGQKLALKSIKKIEEVDVDLFLESKEKLNDAYNDFGGFETVRDLQEVCNIENVEVYIEELVKWDVVYNIIDKFTIDSDQLNKVSNLDADGVYNYYTAILNNTFTSVKNGVVISKMNDGLDAIIADADAGVNLGMPFNSPILCSEIGGWVNGQTYVVGGLSGSGKTSWVQDVILPAIWDLDEPCVIMLNEQDHVKWKQQFLTWIINNIVITNPSKYFNAKRWREGHFTPEEFGWLGEATRLLTSKEVSGSIVLAELKSYSQKEAERIIKQYASIGVKKFILDTFKLSNERNDNEAFWLSMQEDARKFDDLVKPSNLNVALLMTLQLQKTSRLNRYLCMDNIGMSKNVIDVASVALLMRRVFNDEYTGMSHEIKVRKPIPGTESFESVPLEANKKYVIIFIEKNRNGESQTYQIVAEQNLSTLVYKEIGICDIPMT